MVSRAPSTVLGKIASKLEDALVERAVGGKPGRTSATPLGHGDGWSVSDIICTLGPGDRPFEEQHTAAAVAIVTAGTFQYRSSLGSHLMTPGSLFLGNPGAFFECGHEHAAGDRCIAFRFAPEYLDGALEDLGTPSAVAGFAVGRLAPIRPLSPVIARACAALSGAMHVSWEELAMDVATAALNRAAEAPPRPPSTSPRAVARVTEIVRTIQLQPAAPFTLPRLASAAGQSPFHFLRTFRRVTGVTPHQFTLRMRLRDAAARLLMDDVRIIDIALASGFGDLSHFNHAFRAEYGLSPRSFRARESA